MKTTYRVEVYCKNCDWEGIQEIPKSTTVETLSIRDCPTCGCQEMVSRGIPKKDY